MARNKVKDLSSRMNIPSAEVELTLPFMTESMGQQMGGLSMYANSLKRGFGNQTFGVDENGAWLGAPEFSGAPVQLGISGFVRISNSDSTSEITADAIVYYEGDTPVIVIGDP